MSRILSVLIAKNFGAKKQDSIPPVLAVFAVILGGVFLLAAAVGSALSYPFMELLHTPADTIDLASGYIRIIFWGLPFLAVYNVYTATLRGLGDSRIPFLSILVSSLINVLLDILFVAELRWGGFRTCVGAWSCAARWPILRCTTILPTTRPPSAPRSMACAPRWASSGASWRCLSRAATP